MGTQIIVSACYYTGATALVDMPEGKSWDDVESWYVKWDTLCLTFKDKSESDIAMDSDAMDGTDWKRPVETEILEADNDGFQTGKVLDSV